jgi:hypothetical protein
MRARSYHASPGACQASVLCISLWMISVNIMISECSPVDGRGCGKVDNRRNKPPHPVAGVRLSTGAASYPQASCAVGYTCSEGGGRPSRVSSQRSKSHLLIGLGAAAEVGDRVRYVTAAALVNELVEATDDLTLSRTIAGTAFCGQHKTNTTPGSGKDQHRNNTDKTVLPGTRRHTC